MKYTVQKNGFLYVDDSLITSPAEHITKVYFNLHLSGLDKIFPSRGLDLNILVFTDVNQ